VLPYVTQCTEIGGVVRTREIDKQNQNFRSRLEGMIIEKGLGTEKV
jgi:hypothetical protein